MIRSEKYTVVLSHSKVSAPLHGGASNWQGLYILVANNVSICIHIIQFTVGIFQEVTQ